MPRRGLVIAGGGAKGAYAFGCLLAIKEAGIEFVAVSGTSAGALNALLWSTNQLDLGEALWRSLTFESTYPVRFLQRPAASKWTRKAVGTMIVILQLLLSRVRGWPLPNGTPVKSIAALGGVLTGLVVFLLSIVLAGRWGMPSVLGTVAGLSMLIYLLKPDTTTAWACIQLVTTLILVPAYVLIFDQTTHWALAVTTFMCVSIFTFSAFMIIGIVVDGAITRLVLLGRTGLARSIRNILKSSPVIIPTYVTVAARQDIWDPKTSGWYTAAVSLRGTPLPGATEAPNLQMAWVPRYERIDQCGWKLALRICLASAALPFGIVKPVKVGSRFFVDGGVVDNVPIFPFVNSDLDEVWVLMLEQASCHCHAMTIAALNYEHKERLCRLAERPHPKERLVGSTPDKIDPRTLDLDPPLELRIPRLRFITPETHLGNIFTGTLRFEAEFASELIEKGRRETLLLLNQPPARSTCERCKHRPFDAPP